MAAARLVVNRDGYVVDLETGEVVDESPLCYDERCEVPPVDSRDEWERRLRAAPLPRGTRRGGRGRRRGSGAAQRAATVSFKLPLDLAERLNLVVLEGWGTKSGVIRAALRAYLEGGVELAAARGLGEQLRRLARLYSARGFLYAAQYLVRMARVYTDNTLLRRDLEKAEEELEALISHFNGTINDIAKSLGIW